MEDKQTSKYGRDHKIEEASFFQFKIEFLYKRLYCAL